MSLENKIEELKEQIEELSISVENLTYALKGEMGDHLTDCILALSKELELWRKGDLTKITRQ